MINRFLKSDEDSLTGSVFSTLLNLPAELFWQLLQRACHSTTLPQHSGELEDVEYWPHWDPPHTTNTSFIEPDLFLRFSGFDLIIEAKRRDDKQQKAQQWQNECQGYFNEYWEELKPLYFLALGGIHQEQDDQVSITQPLAVTVPVIKVRWGKLLSGIQQLRNDLESIRTQSSQTQAQIRTCQHVIDLFAWHGYFTGYWAGDLPFDKHADITLPRPKLQFSHQ